MADQELIDHIAQGDLITAVDDTRNDYDLRKLPTVLRTLITTRLAAGRAANAAVAMAAGGEAGASAAVIGALARMAGLLRNGYSSLKAIPTEDVPDSEVLEAMESYGWEGGKIGDLESPPAHLQPLRTRARRDARPSHRHPLPRQRSHPHHHMARCV